jgi:hypothetical protein
LNKKGQKFEGFALFGWGSVRTSRHKTRWAEDNNKPNFSFTTAEASKTQTTTHDHVAAIHQGGGVWQPPPSPQQSQEGTELQQGASL